MEIKCRKQKTVKTIPFSEVKPGELFVTVSVFNENGDKWQKFVLQKCYSDMNLPDSLVVRLLDGKIFDYDECCSYPQTPCILLTGELIVERTV